MSASTATSSLAFADVGEFDTTHLVTEDDTPVDNLLTALGEKLLTSALADSWKPPLDEETGEPRVFTALANVGVFTTLQEPAIVPEVAIVLDVLVHPDVTDRTKRSYFAWEQGKVPDLVIEIVSNKTGEEVARIERARADAERARADAERARADGAEDRTQRLLARLRAAGLEP